jgi:hypothetical protein
MDQRQGAPQCECYKLWIAWMKGFELDGAMRLELGDQAGGHGRG